MRSQEDIKRRLAELETEVQDVGHGARWKEELEQAHYRRLPLLGQIKALQWVLEIEPPPTPPSSGTAPTLISTGTYAVRQVSKGMQGADRSGWAIALIFTGTDRPEQFRRNRQTGQVIVYHTQEAAEKKRQALGTFSFSRFGIMEHTTQEKP